MAGESRGGTWPIADVVVLTDYAQPERSAVEGNTTQLSFGQRFLRIHMDVPYVADDDDAGAAAIEDMIKNGNMQTAYKAIRQYIYDSKDKTEPKRAAAVLAAALGLLDGHAPTYP